MRAANREMSGAVEFNTSVSWQAFCNGRADAPQPLIVYLHGYGENKVSFREKSAPVQEIAGWHLFINGPYPLPRPGIPDRGYAWYIYDGPGSDFAAELHRATEVVEAVRDQFIREVQVAEIAVVGFSMGAYLGGYWSLFGSHPPEYAALCGGRIKSELLKTKPAAEPKPRAIAAFHGKHDKSVDGNRQQQSIDTLLSYGYNAGQHWLDCGHRFEGIMADSVQQWLKASIKTSN